MSRLVSRELSIYLGSELTVGQIELGLINRLIIDDLALNDQRGKEMLRVSHLSVRLEFVPLLKGKVSISNVQLFSFHVNLERPNLEDEANFQFLLDALASRDTAKKETNLDLRINSLLIRRGNITYDVLSEDKTPNKFNTKHINLQDITAKVSLKALSNDSVNAAIRNMHVEEANSGLALKNLSLKVTGNNEKMNIENFVIALNHTHLSMDTIRLGYDGIDALGDPTKDVHFSFHLLPSEVYLEDFSPFVPLFNTFKEPVEVEMETSGEFSHFECTKLSVSSGNHFQLTGQVSLQDLNLGLENAYIYGTINRLYADPTGTDFFVRNLSKDYEGVVPVVDRLGTVSIRQGTIEGYLNEPVAYVNLETDIGVVHTDLQLTSDRDRDYFAYKGSVKTTSFKLNKLLDNVKLGDVTLNVGVRGSHLKGHYPTVSMVGNISAFDYSDYTYNNIVLNGIYEGGGFSGEITLDDPNASIRLAGSMNAVSRVPEFDFLAEIEHLRPNDLLLTEKYPDTEFTVRIRADFTGGNIDDMIGEINVDSLVYISQGSHYFMDNFKLLAEHTDETNKRLVINSPFMSGEIRGDYSYRTLPNSVKSLLGKYLPSLLIATNQETVETENDFGFELRVNNVEMLAAMLHLPLTIYTPTSLNGYFNEKTQRINIEGHFPHLMYNGKFIESAMISCENPDDKIHAMVRANNRKTDGSIGLSVDVEAKDDSLQARINWGNTGDVTYSGQLSAVAHFIREEAAKPEQTSQHARLNRHKKTREAELPALRTSVAVHPTHVILSDTVWDIHPSRVEIDSGRIYVDDLGISHENRHLHIHGVASERQEDTLYLDLNSINIGYVFDIAKLGVNFHGEATGPAYACGIFKEPMLTTDLQILNFGINDGHLGDMNIHGEWQNDVKGIFINAHIREEEISTTDVMGYVYPVKPRKSLDLKIDANNTNLKFIHEYIGNITSDFTGRATGHLDFYGKFRELTMNGHMMAEAKMKVDALNTTYTVCDSVFIEPDGITFPGNRIYDSDGNQGSMTGQLRYEHFRNAKYEFSFRANNMLVMDTEESADYPFYGTVYGTGNINITGNVNDGVSIDIGMTTNRKTNFVYIKDFVTSATSNQFIEFIDKTPRRTVNETLTLFEQAKKKMETEAVETDIRLNMLIDATTDANMRIIMDPATGDYIQAKGSGSIRADFYNKGDFSMFGTYTISQGVYKFNLQDIIRREFNIQDGSSITFTGNPYEATLDINASYTVNSASLNDLMSNASNYVDQTNVKVNCLMSLTGQLTAPELVFSLELPNERDEVQALVRNYIPTDEQMNMQILYLLSIGKFYTPENVTTTQNSNMMSSVLSSTISGQLNNALSSLINSNNWNIGTNLSTGEEGWTDMEFETILSGQLLNNRLLINGNFGYRDNPAANTNFVGDFEAEWLVNRSGDIRLKAYNETNDRYYTKTNLTTQGIGIIFRKDFDKWSELMFWKRWKARMRKDAEDEREDEPMRENAQQPTPEAQGEDESGLGSLTKETDEGVPTDENAPNMPAEEE